MNYICKVAFSIEDDKGKVKKQKEQYLVNDVSVTAVEAKVTQTLSKEGERDFEILSVSESKISRVL